MSLTAAAKKQIIKTHQRAKQDTGSSEVQIALLTARINSLTEHLKVHTHDVHTRYGLSQIVSQRRRLLRYLKGTNIALYQRLIKNLEIRG